MKNNLFIDHIYDLIKIEEDVFGILEVFKENIEQCKKENQIPLISKIYPTATHRRWEHQLGVYNLINSCIKAFPSLKKKVDIKELMASALLHNVGHSKFGYDTEEAFLYYVKKLQKDDYFKVRYKEIESIITDECKLCKNKCLDSIIVNNKFELICNWETAKVIWNNKDELSKLKGIDKYKLIRNIACVKHKGYKLLNYFNKIDYVLRDLYYLGVLSFKINLQYLFEKYDKDTSLNDINEFEMINNYLFKYIKANLYNDNRVLIHSRLYQKFFLRELYNSGADINNIASLRNLDEDQKYYDFIEDTSIANKYIEVFSTKLKHATNKSNLEIEEEFLPKLWDMLEYSEDKNVLLTIYQGPESGILNKYLKIYSKADNNKINDLMDLLIAVLEQDIQNKDIRKELLSYIFNKKINIDFDRYSELLKQIILELLKEDKELIHNVINEIIEDYYITVEKDEKEVENKDIETEYDKDNKPEDNNELESEDNKETDNVVLRELIKYMSQSDKNSAKKSIEDGSYEFLNETLIPMLVENPQKIIKNNKGKILIALILAKLQSIINNKDEKFMSCSLEYLIYIKECLKAKETEYFSLIYPSVKILDDGYNSKSAREIDCLVLRYADNRLDIDFIEITTSDSSVKSIGDLTKNNSIIDGIQKKFEDIKITRRIIAPVENIKIETIDNAISQPIF